MSRFGWILNESSAWAQETVPHFECDDKDVTSTYWYRWRLFHLHMAKRPAGKHGCERPGGCWVITEFLKKVFWSGPHNTIVCPAGHHIMEGRWLRDASVVDDYARFWFHGNGYRKQYTWWAAHALWQRASLIAARPHEGVHAELFAALDAHYHDWLATHYSPRAGCMFTSCHADGEENSAGLDGGRPTINSIMCGDASALLSLSLTLTLSLTLACTSSRYGEARALGQIAAALGNRTRAAYFEKELTRTRTLPPPPPPPHPPPPPPHPPTPPRGLTGAPP
ncbi:MAG: hypothetical protein VXW31_00360, partial [Planctomycetota bacterium]|nr:hypothetical protein [Planctomycetota bacterium]